MKVVAITGGIGSGKSTVSQILSKLGYCTFDADIFAREVLFYPEIESRIKCIFGDHVFVEKGILNRELIRNKIYENQELKKQLELILHPAISDELQLRTQILSKSNKNLWIFYEASLILENQTQNKYDACIVVTAQEKYKFERLTQSRNLNQAQIEKIMNSQMVDEEKMKFADFIIHNSSHLDELEKNIIQMIQYLYNKFNV